MNFDFSNSPSSLSLLQPIVVDKDLDKEWLKTVNSYGWLFTIVETINPTDIVEIGVRYGYSAFVFDMAAKHCASYVGFDNASYETDCINYVMHKVFPLMKVKNKKLYKSNTQELSELPVLRADFIHIDGDHTYHGALHDLLLANKVLEEGGTIAVDDYIFLSDVKQAVDEVADHLNYNLDVIPTYRGLALLTRK